MDRYLLKNEAAPSQSPLTERDLATPNVLRGMNQSCWAKLLLLIGALVAAADKSAVQAAHPHKARQTESIPVTPESSEITPEQRQEIYEACISRLQERISEEEIKIGTGSDSIRKAEHQREIDQLNRLLSEAKNKEQFTDRVIECMRKSYGGVGPHSDLRRYGLNDKAARVLEPNPAPKEYTHPDEEVCDKALKALDTIIRDKESRRNACPSNQQERLNEEIEKVKSFRDRLELEIRSSPHAVARNYRAYKAWRSASSKKQLLETRLLGAPGNPNTAVGLTETEMQEYQRLSAAYLDELEKAVPAEYRECFTR